MGDLDPEKMKVPAYLRKKSLVRQSKQRLLWTAFDRKEAAEAAKRKRQTAQVAPKKVDQNPRNFNSAQDFYRDDRFQAKQQQLISVDKRFSREQGVEDTKQFETDLRPRRLKEVGLVCGYIEELKVAIVHLSDNLRYGDIIIVEAKEGLFLQRVEAIEIDRQAVAQAKKDEIIGLKVAFRVGKENRIYKV